MDEDVSLGTSSFFISPLYFVNNCEGFVERGWLIIQLDAKAPVLRQGEKSFGIGWYIDA